MKILLDAMGGDNAPDANIKGAVAAINQIKAGNYEEGFDLIKDDPSLESDICITFLLKYIVYAIQITKTISLIISNITQKTQRKVVIHFVSFSLRP